MDAVNIVNLSKTYNNSVTAVDRLSLDLKKGTMLGFLGPNGAGKSTTIKIMTNLIAPTSGSISIDGVDVHSNPKEALSYVGTVVETPEFYPFLTANETMMLMGQIRGMTRSEIGSRSEDILSLLGLSERADSRVGTFSKGMKQRLALAQAILHQPTLLILDEPTSGLDPRGMVEMREILKSLKKNGHSIFMSSHMLPEVQETCDFVAVIDRGRLLLHKSVDEISSMANSGRIEIVLAGVPTQDMMNKISTLEGVRSIERVTSRRLEVDFSGDAPSRERLLREMLACGLRIESYSAQGLALEKLYLDLVEGSE